MSKTPQTEDEGESTVDWLYRLLGGSADFDTRHETTPRVRYLYRPNAAHPQLLLPLDNRVVTASALQRFHDSRTKQMTLINLASSALGHARLARFGGGEIRKHPQFELVNDLATKLGEHTLFASIILGPKRRNRKPVIQLIRPDGVVVGFAKLGWSELTRNLVRNECELLREVENRLPDTVEAPKVLLEETTVDGHKLVITSAVHNGPFARRKEPLSLNFVLDLARSLSGGVQELRNMPFLKTWSKNKAVQPFAKRILDRHGADSRLEIGLWHGDLTPWNTSTTNRKIAIWDWEFASTDRPVGFDLLHDLFESSRRTKNVTAKAALAAMVSDGTKQLSELTRSTDIIVDLYLCELLHREHELEGQRWDSETIKSSEEAITDLLQERLGDNHQ